MAEEDITTLAIEVQSKEAEANLKSFNELMQNASKLSGDLKPVKFEVDAESAISQLRALKIEYVEMQNVSPTFQNAVVPPDMGDTFERLVNGFEASRAKAEAMQEEFLKVAEGLRQLDGLSGNLDSLASSQELAAGTRQRAATVNSEYAQTLKEITAAQREFAKAAEKSDEATAALVNIENQALAIKKELSASQRELKTVTAALAETHRTFQGDVIGLSQKEDALRSKVEALKKEYKATAAELGKYTEKQEQAGEAADEARSKVHALKEKLAGLPAPIQNTGNNVGALSPKLARLTRGFGGLMSAAGMSIPGLNGMSRAVTSFGTTLGPAGLAVGAFSAVISVSALIYKNHKKDIEETTILSKRMAEESGTNAKAYREQITAQQKMADRLQELNSFERLSASQKDETISLVGKLTREYSNLGVVYDENTGKIKNLKEVTEKLNAEQKKQLEAKLRMSLADSKAAAEKAKFDYGENAVGFFSAQAGDFVPGQSETSKAQQFVASLTGMPIEKQIKMTEARLRAMQKLTLAAPSGLKTTSEKWLSDATNQEKKLRALRDALIAYRAAQDAYNAKDKPVDKSADNRKNERAEKDRTARLQKAAKQAFSGLKTVRSSDGTLLDITGIKSEDETYKEKQVQLKNLQKEYKDLGKRQNTDKLNTEGLTVAMRKYQIEADIAKLSRETLMYDQKKQKEILNLQAQQARAKENYVFEVDTAALEKAKKKLAREKEKNPWYDSPKVEAAKAEVERWSRPQIKREKTTEEKYRDINAKIKTKQTEVDKLPEGSAERLKAENELSQLKEKQFNMGDRMKKQIEREVDKRKELNSLMMQQLRFQTNIMQKSVEAGSSEARTLETRRFASGKNDDFFKQIAANTLNSKEIIERFETYLKTIAAGNGNLKEFLANI